MSTLSSSAGSVYAQSVKSNLVYVECSTGGFITPNQDNNVTVSLPSDVITENSTFEVAFSADKSIASSYFVNDGISVLSQNSKTSEQTYYLQSEKEFGKFECFFDFGDGVYQQQSIFTYTTEGKTFISTTGEDAAWFLGMCYKYNNGLITRVEMEYERSIYNQKYITYSTNNISQGMTVTRLSSYTFSAYGVLDTFLWAAPVANGVGAVTKPLKFAKVELYDYYDYYVYGNETPIATTYTDANGSYLFTYDEDDNYDSQVFIRVYPESTTFRVQSQTSGGNYNDYHMDSNSCYIGTWSGQAQEISFSITAIYSGSDICNAYYVFQGMVVGQRFALEMGMSTPGSKLPVVYPASTSPVNTSRTTYSISVNSTTSIITSATPINIEIVPNDKYMWDAFTHEYGHFVRIHKGLIVGNLYSSSTPGSHTIFTDHFDDGLAAACGKAYTMEFTWNEAWATAFSQIAQEKYKSEYNTGNVAYSVAYASDGIVRWADGLYGAVPDLSSYDYFETENGEGQEFAIVGFLWDLSQQIMGYQNFWNVSTASGIRTLTNLTNSLNSSYPQFRNSIGLYLGVRQIAPFNFVVTNRNLVTTSTAPTFGWKICGSGSYPNNKFEICFYNSSGVLQHTITNITFSPQPANTALITYTLSSGEWSTVLSKFSNNTMSALAYVTVNGYLTTLSPESGPYRSAFAL